MVLTLKTRKFSLGLSLVNSLEAGPYNGLLSRIGALQKGYNNQSQNGMLHSLWLFRWEIVTSFSTIPIHNMNVHVLQGVS